MKILSKFFSILFAGILALCGVCNVQAASSTIYVDLGNLTSITTYDSLEKFLVDYNAGSLPEVYITEFLFDGVGAVKTPDLDDFVEADSNDAKIKTLEIKVININTTGNVEFTGEITGAMIAVNTNDKKGDINIILNGATLDTDSKKAPAIYVYNKDKNYTDAKVTIKTVAGTKNYLEGGKLKKVSLVGADELSNYTNYYSGDSLTNYNKYSNYYSIYTSSEISQILFATVQADNEDLQDGDPYYFYKASGAISSDIDLYFEGSGYLKVTSKNKEGIEAKGNLTFSGGTGDYEIYAEDDCLNTTTASGNGTVHNDIVIDVSSLLAVVNEDADEGDAIDSNGKLTINGGTIYAFAHPSSQDTGLDSVSGTYLNGGTIVATGNMTDQISGESKQKFIYASFSKQIDADTLIVIKDSDGQIVTAFKTGRKITNLLYSSSSLSDGSYTIYTGGTIEGEETNGLYTTINSYSGGEEVAYNNVGGSSEVLQGQKNNISGTLLTALLIEIGALAVVVAIAVICYKTKKPSKDVK